MSSRSVTDAPEPSLAGSGAATRPALVHDRARALREYASHHDSSGWDYTRAHTIKHIRYRGDYAGRNHPLRRVRRWLSGFLPRTSTTRQMLGMSRWWNWRHPIVSGRVALRTDPHLPDGVINNGSVVAYWEEDGEYLQMVQPSVGILLADLMDAHPDLPEVQAIAGELQRIADRYAARIADGDVDGTRQS